MGRTGSHSGHPATNADLEAVPPHLVAEILFGSLETYLRPAPRHSGAANSLGHELTGPFQKGRGGPGGWVFFIEPELHLGPHVNVPDLAAWRVERLPAMPRTAYFGIPPDWVCELLSPATENIDRDPKRRIYATYGVGFMSLVDADKERLEAYVLRDGQYLLHETFDGTDEVKAPPFDAVPFPISALWPLDPAPVQS
jgi:hypothetical protein